MRLRHEEVGGQNLLDDRAHAWQRQLRLTTAATFALEKAVGDRRQDHVALPPGRPRPSKWSRPISSLSSDEMLTAAEPFHPAIRILNHRDSRTFSLTSIPNALADTSEGAARAAGGTVPDPLPLEYGPSG